MPAVPDEVLAHFRVSVVAELKYRVNTHWRVARDGGPAVLRRWGYGAAQVAWETDLGDRLAALGWPVAVLLADPVELDGTWWTLHRLLPGSTREERTAEDQRERGRMLARLHADTCGLGDIAQRPAWRTTAEILADPSLDALFAAEEPRSPVEMRLLRLHLDRARARYAEWADDGGDRRRTVVLHGDLTADNLLWTDGRLSGLLDLEMAHRDVRIADFSLAWRGKYDEAVRGYEEIAPLSDRERALLGPTFWAHLAEGSAQALRRGAWAEEDGWTLRMLRRRSPLMGPDADWVVSAAG